MEEIRNLMHEAVFITDLQARNPPFTHIGMIAIGDMDAAPAAEAAFVTVLEILKAVEVVEVPKNGSVFAVDFEGVEGFVSASISCGFERGERSVPKPGEESTGIIDANFFDFSGQVVLALLDKGFGHSIDGFKASIQPESGVDAVGKEVAGNAAAGDFDVEAPKSGATLRQVL